MLRLSHGNSEIWLKRCRENGLDSRMFETTLTELESLVPKTPLFAIHLNHFGKCELLN